MNDKNTNEGAISQSQTPTPKRAFVIRILNALKRNRNRSRGGGDEQHAKNERVMARWTRTVGIFTTFLAVSGIAGNIIIWRQLVEMHSGGIDTHNLALAASNEASAMGDAADAMGDQANATGRLREAAGNEATAMDKLRKAGEDQATAMGRLEAAGKVQARATQLLADAGKSQAVSTAALVSATSSQLAAIQAQANAAKIQAEAVTLSSKATNRLADAGQAQSAAVLESLGTAKEANTIAQQNAISANRPWAGFALPGSVGPQAGQDYKVEAGLFNYGRSPAVGATVTIAFEIIPKSQNIKPLSPCISSCQVMTIFPNTGFSSNGYAYHPILLKERITAEEIERLKMQQDVILLLERVDYSDSYGQSHSTTACSFFLSDVGFTNCPFGNAAN